MIVIILSFMQNLFVELSISGWLFAVAFCNLHGKFERSFNWDGYKINANFKILNVKSWVWHPWMFMILSSIIVKFDFRFIYYCNFLIFNIYIAGLNYVSVLTFLHIDISTHIFHKYKFQYLKMLYTFIQLQMYFFFWKEEFFKINYPEASFPKSNHVS